MEILQFLISFLSSPQNLDKISGLINAFKNGNFNIETLLKNIDLSTILPFLEQMIKVGQNKSPTEWVGQSEGLTPIANVADKDIVFALNKYLSQPV